MFRHILTAFVSIGILAMVGGCQSQTPSGSLDMDIEGTSVSYPSVLIVAPAHRRVGVEPPKITIVRGSPQGVNYLLQSEVWTASDEKPGFVFSWALKTDDPLNDINGRRFTLAEDNHDLYITFVYDAGRLRQDKQEGSGWIEITSVKDDRVAGKFGGRFRLEEPGQDWAKRPWREVSGSFSVPVKS